MAGRSAAPIIARVRDSATEVGFLKRREECPICGLTGRDLVAMPYGEAPMRELVRGLVERFPALREASFALRECALCGLVWQVAAPVGELANAVYDDGADAHFLAHDYFELYAAAAQEVMMFVAALRRPPRELRFLDFGMGWGRWARMAAAFGTVSYGVELSERMRAYAAGYGVRVVELDDVEPASIDVVNTEQVFEHLAEPVETLARLRSLVRPDGLVKISVPDATDLRRRLRVGDWSARKGSRNSLNVVAPLEHVNAYRRSSLLALGRRVGLVETTIPMGVQWSTATDWRVGRPLVKNVARPLYRNWLRRGTYVLLRPA